MVTAAGPSYSKWRGVSNKGRVLKKVLRPPAIATMRGRVGGDSVAACGAWSPSAWEEGWQRYRCRRT